MASILGIGGVSQAGKSTLAKQLVKRAKRKRVLVLDMDDYVLPEHAIPSYRGLTDWDRPESVDYERIITKITENRDAYDLIILEGILIFANEDLRTLFDYTIHMSISKETFLKRRSKVVRWGLEPHWYLEHVWDSWLQYGQFPQADLQLVGEKDIKKKVQKMILKSLLG